MNALAGGRTNRGRYRVPILVTALVLLSGAACTSRNQHAREDAKSGLRLSLPQVLLLPRHDDQIIEIRTSAPASEKARYQADLELIDNGLRQ